VQIGTTPEDESRSIRSQAITVNEHQGYVARPPTPGEHEALGAGIDTMGIPRRGQPARG
jgi:hypothetical protein